MIDFSREMQNLDGSNVTISKDEALTLGKAVASALAGFQPSGQNADPTQAVRCYILAQKIYAGGNLEIEAADVVLMKSAVVRQFTPLVSGQACALLDPPSVPG